MDVDPLDIGAQVAIASPAGVPGLRGSEDALGILLSAIDSRQAVQFPHRPSRAEPYTTRTVEPWGVVTEKGRWYLSAMTATATTPALSDSRGSAPRSRRSVPPGAVTVPDHVDLRKIVADSVAETPTGVQGQGMGRGRAGHRPCGAPDFHRSPATGRPQRRGD